MGCVIGVERVAAVVVVAVGLVAAVAGVERVTAVVVVAVAGVERVAAVVAVAVGLVTAAAGVQRVAAVVDLVVASPVEEAAEANEPVVVDSSSWPLKRGTGTFMGEKVVDTVQDSVVRSFWGLNWGGQELEGGWSGRWMGWSKMKFGGQRTPREERGDPGSAPAETGATEGSRLPGRTRPTPLDPHRCATDDHSAKCCTKFGVFCSS